VDPYGVNRYYDSADNQMDESDFVDKLTDVCDLDADIMSLFEPKPVEEIVNSIIKNNLIVQREIAGKKSTIYRGGLGFSGLGLSSLLDLNRQIDYVQDSFDVSKNNLVDLLGSPQSVGGNFDCGYNKLTSLEGAPQEVGGDFYCSGNELTSLEGAPQSVSGSFYCSGNELTSLEGAPQSVGGKFDCGGNKLTSFSGAPKKCTSFDFSGCKSIGLEAIARLETSASTFIFSDTILDHSWTSLLIVEFANILGVELDGEFLKEISADDFHFLDSAIGDHFLKFRNRLLRVLSLRDKKDVNEATTGSSISYVPGGFTSVTKALSPLKKQKVEWGIKVVDNKDIYDVSFEDQLLVRVPKKSWGEFSQKAFGGNKVLKRLNLNSFSEIT
jgi:hypothetical protein